jgi:hypothetical protein
MPATVVPSQIPVGNPDFKLNLSVVFTSGAATIAALKSAEPLAARMGCSLTIVVPQVVPYPLPLEHPPVLRAWNEERIGALVSEAPIVTTVQLFLCRDRATALLSALKPHSIVFIGGRKRWLWPTPEEVLAKTLRRAGHEVIFAGME